MLTDLQWPIFAANRLVQKEDLGDHFLEYYRETIRTLNENILFPQSGVFQAVSLAADGNDRFQIGAPSPLTGISEGHIIDINADPTYCSSVQFENALGIDYYVAVGRNYFPVGVDVSPKDGQPRIKYFREIIGCDTENPDAVVDNGDGTLTLTIDTATEPNVSNAGRKIIVLQSILADGATDEDKAWQICDVAWDGLNNKITTSDVAPKNGYLGQTIPSTTVGDYLVILLGPYVKRNTDLSTTAKYCYLGTVTGVGAGGPPVAFDTSGQIIFGTGGISNLHHITRTENVPPDRLKIDVKAIAAEEGSGISQIRVSGWDGIGGAKTVFDVDELGNVTIEGDLVVEGTTIQEDLVTVNASEIIADNLTLGDADGDSHLVKGTWWHRNAAETQTWFVVDSATGHVGVGVAADATYHLNVGSGGVQCDGDIIPKTTGYTIGDPVAGYWHSVYIATGVFHNEGDNSGQIGFRATGCEMEINANLPRLWISDADAGHIDERHFSIEVGAARTLQFKSWNSGKAASAAWLQVVKTANSHAVKDITMACDDQMTLAASGLMDIAGNSLAIDSTTTMVITSGGQMDLTPTGWLHIDGSANITIDAANQIVINSIGSYVELTANTYVDLDAPYTQTKKLMPVGDQAHSFGDATHRWQYLWPSAKGGEGFKQSVVPADDISYALGTYNPTTESGYRWTGVATQQAMITKSDFPTLYMFIEGQAADEGLYGLSMQNNKHLSLATFQDGGTIGTEIWKVTRGAGTVVTRFEFGADVILQAGFSLGQDTNAIDEIFGELLELKADAPILHWHETDQSANRKGWSLEAVAGDLFLRSYNGAFGAFSEAVKFTRSAGDVTAFDEMMVAGDVVPSGAQSIGRAGAEWGAGYFSGAVHCQACHVDGDSGGVANTNTLTSNWSGVSTGAGSILMNSSTPGPTPNTGWLHVRIGTNLRYIPYWTNITP